MTFHVALWYQNINDDYTTKMFINFKLIQTSAAYQKISVSHVTHYLSVYLANKFSYSKLWKCKIFIISDKRSFTFTNTKD